MNWLKDNALKILAILFAITFGYANFTRDIKANADGIKLNEERIIEINKKLDNINEKVERGVNMIERIDERTKRL